MIDEEKFGHVVGETLHYIRVRMDGGNYSGTKTGRLKLKENIKEGVWM